MVVVTAEREGVCRGLLEAHKHIGNLPLFNLGPDQPDGGWHFQDPGEGPWRVFPPAFRWRPTENDKATPDGRDRIRVAFSYAFHLGRWLRSKNRRVVAWELGGGGNGVIALGLAAGIGRAVCVAPAGPDRLTIAIADSFGVQLRSVLNAEDQRQALAFLGGF